MALRGRIERLWTQLEADTVGDMTAPRQRQLRRGLRCLETNLSSATAGDRAPTPREVDPAHEAALAPTHVREIAADSNAAHANSPTASPRA